MIFLAIPFILLTGSCRNSGQAGQLELYDLHTRQSIAGEQAMDALKSVRLVIVGEHHTDRSHHKAPVADHPDAQRAIGSPFHRVGDVSQG